MKNKFLLILLAFFCSAGLSAQTDTNPKQTKVQQIVPNPIPPKPDVKQGDRGSTNDVSKVLPPNTIPTSTNMFRTSNESLLTILMLTFGVIILGISAFIIYKHGTDLNFLFKYFIIILVIIASVVLMSVGYDKDQVAPAIGLFGTIAGYLLGKADVPPKAANNPPNPNPPANH
jgi:hypothetical protein